MAGTLFSKILVPVDFSSCSEEAFRVALSLARAYQSEILLLHVVDMSALDRLNQLGLALPSEEAKQKKRLRHQARLNARRLLQSDEAKGVPITRLLAEGSPFVEIARAARSEQAGLVVMGSYGGQGGRVEKIFFGSTAEKVVRTAGCPVLCVPLPSRPKPIQRPGERPKEAR
ncbi:MAG: universal stress protein [Nitrospira sp.]|nr:universal stress protein [Nitrospira sp.]